jgi:hypothetical protein
VIEISLKFRKSQKDDDKSIKWNFLELNDKTVDDVCAHDQVHLCVKNILDQVLVKKKLTPETANTITNVIIHQSESDDVPTEITDNQQNSSKRSSMKSSRSMETILNVSRQKVKSPDSDQSKAKSVGNINNKRDDEYIENEESIELIFISDEFVNKVQQQDSVIILNQDKKRDNKRIVIVTNEFKKKALRNHSIVLTKDKKVTKKVKNTVNTNYNSYVAYDEPEPDMDMMDVIPRNR